MFDKKFLKEEKIMDLSLLPPCQFTLYLHVISHYISKYVARILRYSLLIAIKCLSIMEDGWIKNSEIVWVDDAFPDDIMQILVDEDFDE